MQQILTFSRHQSEAAEKQLVDTSSVLEDAIGLMRATIPSSIEIKVRIASNVPMIHANPGQLHQVIVNLCTNAAQAITQSRGHIEINLRRADATCRVARRASRTATSSSCRSRMTAPA